MNTLAIEPRTTFAENVRVTSESLSVELSDGRNVAAPLAWFPRLQHGTAKERNNWRLIGRGEYLQQVRPDESVRWLQGKRLRSRRRLAGAGGVLPVGLMKSLDQCREKNVLLSCGY